MNCIILLVVVILVSVCVSPFNDYGYLSVEFAALDLNGTTHIDYCIEELPKERYTDALNLIAPHDEMTYLREYYGRLLDENKSLYCFKDAEPDEIIGVIVINIKESSLLVKHNASSLMFTSALTVDPRYTNRGIEEQLLRANDKWCNVYKQKFIVALFRYQVNLQTICHDLGYEDDENQFFQYKECPPYKIISDLFASTENQ